MGGDVSEETGNPCRMCAYAQRRNAACVEAAQRGDYAEARRIAQLSPGEYESEARQAARQPPQGASGPEALPEGGEQPERSTGAARG